MFSMDVYHTFELERIAKSEGASQEVRAAIMAELEYRKGPVAADGTPIHTKPPRRKAHTEKG